MILNFFRVQTYFSFYVTQPLWHWLRCNVCGVLSAFVAGATTKIIAFEPFNPVDLLIGLAYVGTFTIDWVLLSGILSRAGKSKI